MITVVLSLVAPYVAEEMWERLGHAAVGGQRDLADGRPGPAGDGLGDLRDPGAGQGTGAAGRAAAITEAELRERALAEPSVIRALAGREVAKVIVRAPKLVSIVPLDRLG